MARYRYRGQCVEKTAGTGAERESEYKLRSEDSDHHGELDVKGGEVHEVEKGEGVKREPPTEKDVPLFCMSFAKISLQLLK